MAELKTKQTDDSVETFLNTIADEQVRKDCFYIVSLMETATGFPAKMWGSSIVGFGQYHYRYDSGHEGDMCLVGFSPRKQNITLYILPDGPDNAALLNKLGKFKNGKGCVYIKKLTDVDQQVLVQLVKACVSYLQKKYG
jgi:hypothetical protein